MLCTPGYWEDAYQALKEDALGGASSARRVLIFVAIDSCDSIAALQILEVVLTKDSVPYGIYPVANEADLVKRAEEMLRDEAERSVVLINCGVTRDIRALLECGPGIRFYVFDSHRPMHFRNARKENAQVLVMCQDRGEEDLSSTVDAWGAMGDALPLDMPSSSSDEDESDEDEDDDDGSDDEGDEEGPASKRRRKEAREERRSLRARVRAYHARGLSYAHASGCVAFDFAAHLQRDDLACLWKAIVALTDHYVHQVRAPWPPFPFPPPFPPSFTDLAPTDLRRQAEPRATRADAPSHLPLSAFPAIFPVLSFPFLSSPSFPPLPSPSLPSLPSQ